MKSILFPKKSIIVLQISLLLIGITESSVCQERFLLIKEDLADYKLNRQGSIYWYDTDHQLKKGVDQEWTENNGNQYLYLNYYECKDEIEAINLISYCSGSFASPYYFGFPTGEIKSNLSWTSLGRNVAFIQKWNVVVQVFTNLLGSPEVAGNIISEVSDKLLYKIRDSINTVYRVSDIELKKHQISIADYDKVIGAAPDTLADNGFAEYKIEDSKWIIDNDSLVMGFRKQWSAENSFFSIDVCGLSSSGDAQKATEQNANIKRSPFFLLDDEASLETAIEHWIYYWPVNDTLRYISIVGKTDCCVIHFYFFSEYGIDIELFKRIIWASTKMETGIINKQADSINFYPNPANDFVTITSPINYTKKYLLVVWNKYGSQVFKREIELSSSYRLNISRLPQGIYFLTLQNEQKRITEKIIVR
jgi:hypothetical protein